jgi:hypothetical protein
MVDRLPDAFYTDNELHEYALSILSFDRYDYNSKPIVIYHLLKENIPTGICAIMPVECIVDGMEQLNRLWSNYNLSVFIGESGEFQSANQHIEHLYQALTHFKYNPTNDMPGVHTLFRHQPWMDRLISQD